MSQATSKSAQLADAAATNSIPGSTHKASLEIIRVPQIGWGTRPSNTENFVLLRRHDDLMKGIRFLLVPTYTFNELVMRKEADEQFEVPTQNALTVEAHFANDDESPVLIRPKKAPVLVIMDFNNAACLDVTALLKTGQFYDVTGRTVPRELSQINGFSNKLFLRYETLRPSAMTEFSEFSDPGEKTIKENPVWDVIIRRRTTPVYDRRQALEELERTRARIQHVISEKNMTIREAKEYLTGAWRSDKTQSTHILAPEEIRNLGSNSFFKYYKSLVDEIPDALLDENANVGKPDSHVPLIRLLKRGYLSETAFRILDERYQHLEDLVVSLAPLRSASEFPLFTNDHERQRQVVSEAMAILTALSKQELLLAPLEQDENSPQIITPANDY